MKAEDLIDVEDHFCGAGGSTTGALLVDGVRVVRAANHSAMAIATHSTNYPEVEHSLGDIPSMNPYAGPQASVLITTPECRAHSYARGRPKNDPHLFKPGDGLDERSRATMDEVPRWAEARRYRAIVVENVPQLTDWCERSETGHGTACNCGQSFRRWLADMTKLGYEHRKLYWNSAFFPPTPQSRDRIYIVFWRRGQRVPELDYRPICWCNECQQVVKGEQRAKAHLKKPASVRRAWGPHDTVWGRYGAQYTYACPQCGERAVPAITPAASAIDWDLPAQRIGDRAKPLAAGTMARISRGLERLAERPLVVPLDYLTHAESRRARDAETDVLATLHGQHRAGLVVQVAGNLGRLLPDGSICRRVEDSHAHTTDQPLKVLHGSIDRGVLVVVGGPRGQQRNARSTADPFGTILAENHRGLLAADCDGGDGAPGALHAVDPWLVPLRRNGRARPASEEPLATICGSGEHQAVVHPTRVLLANYGSSEGPANKQGWARDAEGNPLGTVTARDSHAILEYRGEGSVRRVESPAGTFTAVAEHALVGLGELPPIEDCTFRMLEPAEIGRGMVMDVNAHGKPYVVHGNRRDQVRQYGNAVTPPPMAVIVQAIRDSLQ